MPNNNYIEKMKSGNFPEDDGLRFYQRIIEDEFNEELKEKLSSLEKEMVNYGFHIIPEEEIRPPEHRRIYFNQEGRILEFKWDNEIYALRKVQIHEKKSFCLIKNNKITLIRNIKELKSHLDKILI